MAVVAILAVISAPSFGSLLDSVKLNQSVTELRSALSSTQRQAIRSGQSCLAGVQVQSSDNGVIGPNAANFQAAILTSCQGQSEMLPKGINIVSNITSSANLLATIDSSSTGSEESTSENQSWLEEVAQWTCENFGWFCPPEEAPAIKQVDVVFGQQGRIDFDVVSSQQNPVDPSGKMVAFLGGREDGKKKCIAISRRIGLTRIGTYSGSFDPAAITDTGVCTSLDWKKQ